MFGGAFISRKKGSDSPWIHLSILPHEKGKHETDGIQEMPPDSSLKGLGASSSVCLLVAGNGRTIFKKPSLVLSKCPQLAHRPWSLVPETELPTPHKEGLPNPPAGRGPPPPWWKSAPTVFQSQVSFSSLAKVP